MRRSPFRVWSKDRTKAPVSRAFGISLLLLALAPACGSNKTDTTPGPVPSTEVVALPGLETASLTPRERREWSDQVSTLLAPCPDVPVSIAQCIQENRSCVACKPAAEMLLKQVQAGRAKKEREEAFQMRFDPKRVKTIVTDGSPEHGPKDAIVTIVEWADFECPYCRALSPELDRLVKRFGDQVKVIYKFYPLQIHAHGEPAARAGVAAMAQGKFWQMHHKMFDYQHRLEQSDLESYATELGLDVAKFRADMNAETTTERIEKDKKQADSLGLDGTPMLFINGRLVKLELLTEPRADLEAWVKLDIEMMGKKPNLVDLPEDKLPAPPGSGAPTASVAVDPTAAPTASVTAAPTASVTAAPTASVTAAPTSRPAPK